MAVLAAVLTWAAVLFKARGAWQGSASPARRALWFALLALALGWTLRVDAVYLAVDEVTRVPNLSQLLGDALAMATGCAILGMLLFQTNERSVAERKLRHRLAALLAAVLVMAVAFALAPVDRETVNFAETYSGEDFYLGYTLPYLAFLVYAFRDLARLCRRYAEVSNRRFLTIGMRLIVVASALGICYLALRAAYLVSGRVGDGEGFGGYEAASTLLVAAVTIFAVTGATLPALGPAVATYLALWRLYPLWLALYRANPDVALFPASRAGELLRLRDLDFRLHRRVIEIRDARLALLPHLRGDVADAARRHGQSRGLSGDDLAAVIEAAVLTAALRDQELGRPERGDYTDMDVPGAADLAGEVSWLQKVSRAFASSPVVRAALVVTVEQARADS